MKIFRKITAAAAACLLSAALCLTAGADDNPEAALEAYSIILARPEIKSEDTSWFTFKKPTDLNNDGIPELIVSQLTQRPVIYSCYNGAVRIVYQGNGDGAIAEYYPEAGVFIEFSGRMGSYMVRCCRFDGQKVSVLCSYTYEGEPVSPSGQDYLFEHGEVTFYKGSPNSGEEISRHRYKNLLRRNTKGEAGIPLPSTSYKNTEDNRLAYIYDRVAVPVEAEQ
ncbi:MAG: hypothetical protein J6D53_08475 [Blautia sp.]|nr:hypothetical protein [Blautia sp.]